jgi:hypothetical protein
MKLISLVHSTSVCSNSKFKRRPPFSIASIIYAMSKVIPIDAELVSRIEIAICGSENTSFEFQSHLLKTRDGRENLRFEV